MSSSILQTCSSFFLNVFRFFVDVPEWTREGCLPSLFISLNYLIGVPQVPFFFFVFEHFQEIFHHALGVKFVYFVF